MKLSPESRHYQSWWSSGKETGNFSLTGKCFADSEASGKFLGRATENESCILQKIPSTTWKLLFQLQQNISSLPSSIIGITRQCLPKALSQTAHHQATVMPLVSPLVTPTAPSRTLRVKTRLKSLPMRMGVSRTEGSASMERD